MTDQVMSLDTKGWHIKEVKVKYLPLQPTHPEYKPSGLPKGWKEKILK